MSDDDDRPNGERDSGLLTDVFAPGVITRIQFSAYLFFGLIICLILKGSAGSAFDNVPLLRRGCEIAQAVSMPHTITDVLLSSSPTPSPPPPPAESTVSTLLSAACMGNTLVYRVSFSLALFFLLHFLSVSDLTCCVAASVRAQLQERFFTVKTALLFLILTITFTCVPNEVFASYAWVCMVASAVFLVVQVILLVDFSYQWSDQWADRAERNEKWQYYLAIVSGGCYLIGVVMCVLSFIYFVPHSDCNFNAFAITAVVVVAGIINTLVAIWVPHGSILPSGIVFAYCASMEFITLRSTEDAYCNTMLPVGTTAGSPPSTSLRSLLLSSLLSGMVLAYTVTSSSGNRAAMTLEDDAAAMQTDADEDGHLSGYMYFHTMMIMGSMYMAMLVSDWQVSGGAADGSSVQGGTHAAFWIRHASLWLTMATFLWSLLAPYFCCKGRDYGFDVPEDW